MGLDDYNNSKKNYMQRYDITHLQDWHWLLLVSKNNLYYLEQRINWNRMLKEFRAANHKAGKGTIIPDCLGPELSETYGLYQD